jgi:hypothetical protein
MVNVRCHSPGFARHDSYRPAILDERKAEDWMNPKRSSAEGLEKPSRTTVRRKAGHQPGVAIV